MKWAAAMDKQNRLRGWFNNNLPQFLQVRLQIHKYFLQYSFSKKNLKVYIGTTHLSLIIINFCSLINILCQVTSHRFIEFAREVQSFNCANLAAQTFTRNIHNFYNSYGNLGREN
jgi:hypothetical protein